MKTLFKNTALAATFALAAATGAQAQASVVGIGFGDTYAEAMQNAVRAWIMQSYRDYGVGNWNTASRGPIQCNQQQSSSGGGYSTLGVGVEGDATGSWSCSVSGFPAGVANG